MTIRLLSKSDIMRLDADGVTREDGFKEALFKIELRLEDRTLSTESAC